MLVPSAGHAAPASAVPTDGVTASAAPAGTVPASAAPELSAASLLRGAGTRASAGFCDGGTLDVLEPGPVLAGFTADMWSRGLAKSSDDELIGVLRAWRRLSSWAAAGELAAVAELAGRRDREHPAGPAGGGLQPFDCVADELACALTLTGRSAENLAGRALRLQDLPATGAALAQGRIDMPKALTIIDGVECIEPGLARAVEDKVLTRAPGQTTGELRAAVRRAVLAADPAAARLRREAAEKDARVELWDEPGGTKALAGRDLPPAAVLAADKRISAIARELKNAGAAGSLDLLRAKVYVALLAGQPLDALLPDRDTAQPAQPRDPGKTDQTCQIPSPAEGAQTCQPPSPAEGAEPARTPDPGAVTAAYTGTDTAAWADTRADAAAAPARDSEHGAGAAWQLAPGGLRRTPAPGPASIPVPGGAVAGLNGTTWGDLDLGRLTGSVNLTVPLTTLLNLADDPGEVAGFGPVDAATTRGLAHAAAGHPATRWCLTVTDETGRVIGHGCHRSDRGHPRGAHPGGAPPDAAPRGDTHPGHAPPGGVPRDRPPPSGAPRSHAHSGNGLPDSGLPGSAHPGSALPGDTPRGASQPGDRPPDGSRNLVIKIDTLAFGLRL